MTNRSLSFSLLILTESKASPVSWRDLRRPPRGADSRKIQAARGRSLGLVCLVWRVAAVSVLLIVMNIARGLGLVPGAESARLVADSNSRLDVILRHRVSPVGDFVLPLGRRADHHYLKEILEALPIGTSSSSMRTV